MKRSTFGRKSLRVRRPSARAAEKKKERFARQFHSTEFVEWMKAKPCCTCSRLTESPPGTFLYSWMLAGASQVSHIKSRGAGGGWSDTIPQCEHCHAELHQKGRATFCASRGWPLERLAELAARYSDEWLAMEGNPYLS